VPGSEWTDEYLDCYFCEPDDKVERVGEEGVSDVAAEKVVDLV
jgi:hypothetical protein